MLLNSDHKRWVKRARRKYKHSISFWEELIKEQNGSCALTGVRLLFDAGSGTPVKKGQGCHPLYASVDHINPKSDDCGFQLLCYDINDLKAHLPVPLFKALKRTSAWKTFVKRWRHLAKTQPNNRAAFKQLIKSGK